MKAKILDGRHLAGKIRGRLAAEVEKAREGSSLVPGLAYLALDIPASQHYAAGIKKACFETGIFSFAETFPHSISTGGILDRLQDLNKREDIHGILVQFPLPRHIDADAVMEAVAVRKDVDGIHPLNKGLLFSGRPIFIPCTPKGIVALLKENGIDLAGKRAVVVGRSFVVGKPLALLLLQENATVTICHRKTRNLEEITRSAEVLIAAIGSPQFIKEQHVMPESVVVDVGIHQAGERLVGDVDYEAVSEIASFITPVPGGVGPMTVASLLENTFKAFQLIKKGGLPADSKKRDS